MAGHILLYTGRLNQRFSQIEQEMTVIRDQMDVLRTEELKLAQIWQGEAKVVWSREFQRRLTELAEAIEENNRMMIKIKETARKLSEEEKKIYALAEAL